MNNLNPYNESVFRDVFKQTEIYKALYQTVGDNLIWAKFFHLDSNVQPVANTDLHEYEFTPRWSYANYFSAQVFYYLMPLLEKEYNRIYDLGCGRNMFKPYIPRLVGVSADADTTDQFIKQYNCIKDSSWPSISTRDEYTLLPDRIKTECVEQHKLDINQFVQCHGDEYGVVDDEYVATHQNYFESVFSICALHFHPITDFLKIVKDFISMVKPEGRGFLSLNVQRMVDCTDSDQLRLMFGHENPSTVQLDTYIRTELDKINNNWLIVDVDLTIIDESMDGNIRLVFEK